MFDISRYTPYSYYTIKETNWEKIGIKWNGQEGEICLIINDQIDLNYFPTKICKNWRKFSYIFGK